ncbi:hypothetical protein BC938DRAFT_475127 [Jimgerdemannia flammicorona]|uniref:Uncharacterized protein n=1 Tax=Jimgerdemannia flammicorona TaxID=994334 RepID=A0A433QRY5_9FUNG|nr:hypothetical protein BC938DRAFT_475127 [Jimgerdemannia flammicorona]
MTMKGSLLALPTHSAWSVAINLLHPSYLINSASPCCLRTPPKSGAFSKMKSTLVFYASPREANPPRGSRPFMTYSKPVTFTRQEGVRLDSRSLKPFTLSREQQEALEIVLEGKDNVFLTGSAGKPCERSFFLFVYLLFDLVENGQKCTMSGIIERLAPFSNII